MYENTGRFNVFVAHFLRVHVCESTGQAPEGYFECHFHRLGLVAVGVQTTFLVFPDEFL